MIVSSPDMPWLGSTPCGLWPALVTDLSEAGHFMAYVFLIILGPLSSRLDALSGLLPLGCTFALSFVRVARKVAFVYCLLSAQASFQTSIFA